MEESTCHWTTLRNARMRSSKRSGVLPRLAYAEIGRDIDALINHIGSGLSGELDSSRIAVMGGSCDIYFLLLLMRALNTTLLRWWIYGICEFTRS